MKMSQFREGSLGRLESHDWGIPVYLRAAFMPDSWTWGAVGVAPLEDIGLDTSRTPVDLNSVTEAASEAIYDHVSRNCLMQFRRSCSIRLSPQNSTSIL